MRPLFVGELTKEELQALRDGLRSSCAFTVRRCQILLTSAEGRLKPREIAERLHCSDQFVCNAIRAFHREGLACLQEKSHAPHDPQSAFDAAGFERLPEVIRQSPRAFDQETSVWTLDLLAEVCWAEGLTAWRASDESMRRALTKSKISWKRTKKWIQSPDERYGVKKTSETS
jgi:transposase